MIPDNVVSTLLIGLSLSTNIAAGKFVMIFDIDASNLCFNEPYKDLPASLIPPLNLIFSFFFTLPFCVVPPLNSSFKSFNVKKSENGCNLKSLLSFSGMTLLISKFVLVS